MTRYIASVTSDLNRANDPSGYKLAVCPELRASHAPLDRLIQGGPVVNNVRLDIGSFPEYGAALAAVIEFIGVPCVICADEDDNLYVKRQGSKIAGRIVASKSRSGIFIAN